MSVFGIPVSPSLLLQTLPKVGGLHLAWEKKPANGAAEQVIEIKISPDHLQACRDSGVCVEGCPSRSLLFVGHLLIRK